MILVSFRQRCGSAATLKVKYILHHSLLFFKKKKISYVYQHGVCMLIRRRMSDRSATLNQLLEKSARRNAENTNRPSNDGIIHNIHHTIAGRRRFYKTVDIARHDNDNDYVRKSILECVCILYHLYITICIPHLTHYIIRIISICSKYHWYNRK